MRTPLHRQTWYGVLILAVLLAVIGFTLADLGGKLPTPPPVPADAPPVLNPADVIVTSERLAPLIQPLPMPDFQPAHGTNNPFFTLQFLPQPEPEPEPEPQPPPPPKTEKVSLQFRGLYILHSGESHAWLLVNENLMTVEPQSQPVPGWWVESIDAGKIVLRGPDAQTMEIAFRKTVTLEIPKQN